MGLTKKQLMWAGIILLLILAYVLFFKKRAKATSVAENINQSTNQSTDKKTDKSTDKKTDNSTKEESVKSGVSKPKETYSLPNIPNIDAYKAALFYSMPKIANQQDEEKEVWFKSKYSVADESDNQSYVGPQDCIEPCEKAFQFQRARCFNKLNNGLVYNLPSSADNCIKLAERRKLNCVSKCSNAYPTNQNFNYDVRGNFKSIIGNTLFEQGYI